jgi:hypothetical protein
MFTNNARRVSENTADWINEKIRRQTEANVGVFAAASPQMITRRLAELDREWDIERFVETMAPAITLFGLVCGATVNKKWLILSGVVQSFFLQHALQGWCPPIPVLRRFGVRTMDEINQERYALKVLRGDFEQVAETTQNLVGNSAGEVMKAVRR